eukprot:403348445
MESQNSQDIALIQEVSSPVNQSIEDPQVIAKLKESMRDLEDRMYDQSRDAMQKLNSYEKQIQSYQKRLSALDELQMFKSQENSSIVEGLANQVKSILEEKMMDQIQKMFMDRSDFGKIQQNYEEQLVQVKSENEGLKKYIQEFEISSMRSINLQGDEIQSLQQNLNEIILTLEQKSTTTFVKGNFATKDEITELNNLMIQYTPINRFNTFKNDVADEFKELDKDLEELYFQKGEVERLIEDVKQHTNHTFQTLSNSAEFQEKNEAVIVQIQADINQLDQKQKRTQHELKSVQNTLPKKAENTEIKKVWENFVNYCSYQDLKDLYNKVMPPLSSFESKMMEMSRDYDQSKEMIRRYDEVLLEKANKMAIKEVYETMAANYVKNKPYDESYSEHEQKLQKLFEETKEMRDNLQIITENINKDIHSAVRRATTQLKSQLQNSFGGGAGSQSGTSISNIGSGIGLDNNELRKILIQKVDKQELDKVMQVKSNKLDVEQALKSIDILHKQICHQIVLFIELLKLLMNPSNSPQENQKTKEQKKMFVLSQAINVCKWINQFDPENINNEDLILPPELKQLQEHGKHLVMEFPKMDQVADLALRKYKLRDNTLQKIESVSQMQSPVANSPLKIDRDLLPSQQLEKYITMSLSTSRTKKSSQKDRNLSHHKQPMIAKSLQVEQQNL